MNVLSETIKNVVLKHLPKRHFGILFSGGIDSLLLAYLAKQAGAKFTCYTTNFKISNKESDDLKWAKKAAKKYGFGLVVANVSLNEAEQHLKEVVSLVGPNVVSAGIGLTLYPSLMTAQKDGINEALIGMGVEDIFAGYHRHLKIKDLNADLNKGIRNSSIEAERDDAVANHFGIKLLRPYLDLEIIKVGMSIPSELKIKNKIKKAVFREAAVELGVDKEFAYRPKKAAQYGSLADKAIAKLAKKQGFKYKSKYLKSLMKLGVLYSSGKDSNLALDLMMQKGYEITCLITIKSKNPDSYMYHTPNIDIVSLQAEALGLPAIFEETLGEKEIELSDLRRALQRAKKEYGISGIVTGALYSNYQKKRIEKICNELGLKVFSPLWHMNQEEELRILLSRGYKFIMTRVAAEGLDKSWLGRIISKKDVDKLCELRDTLNFNVAGEGGEYESLVLYAPSFKKEIVINNFEIVDEGNRSYKLIIKDACLKARRAIYEKARF